MNTPHVDQAELGRLIEASVKQLELQMIQQEIEIEALDGFTDEQSTNEAAARKVELNRLTAKRDAYAKRLPDTGDTEATDATPS